MYNNTHYNKTCVVQLRWGVIGTTDGIFPTGFGDVIAVQLLACWLNKTSKLALCFTIMGWCFMFEGSPSKPAFTYKH